VDGLSRFLVQQPLHILAVALVHLLLWAKARFGKNPAVRHSDALLAPALGWMAYAARE
jgi:hypothetical protein